MKKIIIVLTFALVGCELVVDVKVPERPPKITVNAAFTEDSVFSALLSKSKYVLESGAYEFIQNAEVQLIEDGEPVGNLHFVEFDRYESPAGITPRPGRTYEIVVSAPGMETVHAQSSLPSKAELKEAIFEWKNQQGSQVDYNYTIDLKFNDNGSSEDFYEIEVYMEYEWVHWETGDTIRNHHPVHISTENPAFSQENIDGVIFDDKLINGKEVKLKITGFDFSGSDAEFFVTLRSLSKDLYRYKLTSQLQSNLGGDPFAQPVHVHNNITNGFGIFGGYQEHTIQTTQ